MSLLYSVWTASLEFCFCRNKSKNNTLPMQGNTGKCMRLFTTCLMTLIYKKTNPFQMAQKSEIKVKIIEYTQLLMLMGCFFLVFYVCFYCVKKVISSSFSSGLHLLHLLHIDHLRSQNHIAYVSALLSASTTSNIFSSSKRHHEVNF